MNLHEIYYLYKESTQVNFTLLFPDSKHLNYTLIHHLMKNSNHYYRFEIYLHLNLQIQTHSFDHY